MKHFLLFYDVVDDYAVRRVVLRSAHLQHAWAAHEGGKLLLGGALVDPLDGAVLLFQGDSPRGAEEFARADPYVVNGLVKSWHVREWNTVVGMGAAAPARP